MERKLLIPISQPFAHKTYPIVYAFVKYIDFIVHWGRNIAANPYSCHSDPELTGIETIDA